MDIYLLTLTEQIKKIKQMEFLKTDLENQPAKKTEESIPSIPETEESNCVEADHDSYEYISENIF